MFNLNIISRVIFNFFLSVYPMIVTAADANESSVLTASCWSCKLLVNIGQPSAGPKIYRGDSFSASSHQRYHHEYADEAFSGKPHNSPAGDLSCSPHFDFALCIPFQSTPRILKFFFFVTQRGEWRNANSLAFVHAQVPLNSWRIG